MGQSSVSSFFLSPRALPSAVFITDVIRDHMFLSFCHFPFQYLNLSNTACECPFKLGPLLF